MVAEISKADSRGDTDHQELHQHSNSHYTEIRGAAARTMLDKDHVKIETPSGMWL